MGDQYRYNPGQGAPNYGHNNYFQPSNNVASFQSEAMPTSYVNEGYPMPTQIQNPSQLPFNPLENASVPNQFVHDIAIRYGTEAFGHGKQIVQQKVERFMSISTLKHFFSVDNAYVARKLSVLLFPFFHHPWDLKYDSTGPVTPRSDLNSPDLYIPLMSFLTYVLIAGLALGIDGRFSPESLGIFSSQSFGWLVFEVCLLTFALYLLNIQSNLGYFDIMAYSGYKFVHMNVIVLAFLTLDKAGYYFALIWTGLAFAFFQIRSLKLQVLPQADRQPSWNPRRGVYLLACTALFQPLVIWWLTSSVIFSKSEN